MGQLAFDGKPPDAAALGRKWHLILDSARRLVSILPPEEVGTCVLDASGALFRGSGVELERALGKGTVVFHRGRIRGALPRIKM